MDDHRTAVEWPYTPGDFFEAEFTTTICGEHLLLKDGWARVEVSRAQDPIDPNLLQCLTDAVRTVLHARQLSSRRAFELHDPRVHQRSGGRTKVEITVGDTLSVSVGVDAILTDQDSSVLVDTRARRIESDHAQVASIAEKALRSPALRQLMEFYNAAVMDPDNELVHLYEVRDALAELCGSKAEAQRRLGIPCADWERVGKLANAEPLNQGRHRGKHLKYRRPASQDELRDARNIILKWILEFARGVRAPNDQAG